MSVPDEVIRQKVVQWLAYGGEDLRLARHGLTMPGGCSYRLIAYHAQQCAEKHLKMGTDTIIVTIRGVRCNDRACHGLPESLHPVTRIM